MSWVIITIDLVFFIITTLTVIYLLVFSIASTRKKQTIYPASSRKHKFAVMFPAYKEDKVILDSVQTFLNQNYPREKYDLIVISDKMKEETDAALSQLPIILLKVNFENSSKAKALNFAIQELRDRDYDGIVIMDADNLVENNFLELINNAFSCSCQAIQTHRKAKNLDTDTAILDGLSEEINNSIFRAGHAKLGLSAALIGSGMIFDYGWFRENINNVHTSGEDKEIEALLLNQKIFIHYLEDVYVYDEKIRKEEAFKQQRLRWLAAQFESFSRTFKQLPEAIRNKNLDYCDKILQMVMLPRIIILLLILIFAAIISILHPVASIKWWVLLSLFMLALYLAIPRYMLNRKIYKAYRKLPVLGMIMLVNIFRIRKVGKQFIHTSHGETEHK